ncbi:hypothetical protein DRH27_04475, partial [Candidatus Falkowbacteria bacterium]
MQYNMTIKCPNDGEPMKIVKTESHYGTTVELDQCEECGGLWLDNTELYRIKHGVGQRIDKLNQEKLKESSPIKKDLYCPRDNSKLIVFKDHNFPKEIQVERCPECGGFFFNRGELVSFQTWRKMHIAKSKPEPKLISKKDKDIEKQIKKLLAMGSSIDSWNTIGQVGKFLSTPVNSSGQIAYGANKKDKDKLDSVG